MIGYSQRIIRANKHADKRMLGVQLGRRAIELNVSVVDIANTCKVSRTAVYAWFTGVNDVSPKHEQAVKDLLDWFNKTA